MSSSLVSESCFEKLRIWKGRSRACAYRLDSPNTTRLRLQTRTRDSRGRCVSRFVPATKCLSASERDASNRLEGQIAAEAHTSDIVGTVQLEVHNFYAETCEPAFQSLRKAASLMGSTNSEDHALLLTSVRRAVKAVADYHYPPRPEPVRGGSYSNRR